MIKRSHLLARGAAVSLTAAALAATTFAPPAAAEPTWLPVEDLSDGTTMDLQPEVAVGANGTAVAIWTKLATNGTFTVVASKRTGGGSWSTPAPVSGAHEDGQLAHVVVDSAGNASAIWSNGNDASGAVKVSHRSASASSWSAPVTLAATGGQAQIAVDTNRNLLAAWTNGTKVYTATKPATGSWSSPVAISGTGTSAYPDIAFDGAGNATAVWDNFEAMDYDVKSARRPAGQTWGAPVTVAGSGEYERHPVLTVDHSGNAVTAWDHPGFGVSQVEASYRLGGGTWSAPADVSSASSTSAVADIDIDESGNVALVYNETVEETSVVRASSLKDDGTWTAPATLSSVGASAQASNVSIDKAGNAAVSLLEKTETGSVAQVALKPVGGAWSSPSDLSAGDGKAEGVYAKHDSNGDLTTVWHLGPGTETVIQARTLDTAGPIASIKQPSPSRQTATSFGAEWSASDRWSAVADYDVRYREAAWNGDFGTHAAWKTATTDTTATLDGAAGKSYCFSARARDEHGNEGAWSSERCTATPLDDYSLSRSGTWTRGTSSSYYLGTYTSTKTSGAALIRTGVKAKHISLLATKCATCGSVKVFFDGTSLGTFNLAASTTARKQLISVKTFTSVQSGTLKIQVVSPTGKTVYMDGVVLRAF